MAVWTAPKTWVNGETPTGAQFNTHIRDNELYLKDSPTFDGNVIISGALTVGTTLAVTGALTFNGAATFNAALTANGNVTLGNAAADVITVTGTVVGMPLKTYTETRTSPAIAASALALDCSQGTYFTVALNSNCTVSFTNVPASGRVVGITVIFTADGTLRTITWPAAVKWASGITPTMTSTNTKRDVITLITEDGGTTWIGVVVGQNY